MEKVKVFILDDHAVFCEALSSLLTVKGDVDVVGTAANAEDAFKGVERLNPDIVLIDIEMKNIDGIHATRMIKEKFPNTEVIVLTMHTEEQYLIDSINAGAKGYILKDFPSSFLLEAIKSVSKGESLLDPKSSNKVLREFRQLLRKKKRSTGNGRGLSQREIEILRLIAEGNTNKEIGKRLYLSIHTVRNHIANIFLKLNCNSRTRAIVEGHKRGLI